MMSGICRICLTTDTTKEYVNIHEEIIPNLTVLQCIINCSSIKDTENELFPEEVCEDCLAKLKLFNEFRQLILQSHETLQLSLSTKTETTEMDDEDSFEQSHESLQLSPSTKNEKTDSDDDDTQSQYDHDYALLDEEENITVVIKGDQSETTEEPRTVFECEECKKVFNRHDHLKVHMTSHTGEKKYACDICPKKFARSYVLMYHRRTHTNERPYQCDICLKTFNAPSNFSRHKILHTNNKRFKCSACDEGFYQLESLNVHIRKAHTGERPYLCDVCSRTFQSQNSLYIHQIDIHGKKDPCPLCGGMYSARIMKKHIRRHQEQKQGIKKFSCDECGKNFTSAAGKKKHLLTHTEEKPFICEICKRCFNQESALKTHMKVHSNLKLYSCIFCTKSFKYKHHFDRHLDNHHQDKMETY
ncbi:zinc finger protein OZF-like [Sitophilus oryzae]|uniref:Zinc finger protein OZF-like n=1 Tax=Sitophilus oryzae TaxID=7048 RepID=A0A6J2YED7_SITOR|nr:zinc finger protein OZF-like [Sitophilus oryzae]